MNKSIADRLVSILTDDELRILTDSCKNEKEIRQINSLHSERISDDKKSSGRG